MKIYLYGMICGSNSFRLNEFPKPDEYSEIQQSARFIGGETGTCATVLSSLDAQVRIDGTHIGRSTSQLTRDFYKNKTVDLGSLTFDDSFEGLEDYVIITGCDRTPFGRFGHFFGEFYNDGVKHWNSPKESDIAWCDFAAIDEFFGEDSQAAAEMCVRLRKPYVTIDCKYDSYIHRHAAVDVVSGEGLKMHYGDVSREEMFLRYAENTDGLTIITNGGNTLLYGRKGEPVKTFQPFRVDVASTLGAGDTFKAGCAFALANGMSDDELVKFASACAGVAVSRYPMQLDPPRLQDIEELIIRRFSERCRTANQDFGRENSRKP